MYIYTHSYISIFNYVDVHTYVYINITASLSLYIWRALFQNMIYQLGIANSIFGSALIAFWKRDLLYIYVMTPIAGAIGDCGELLQTVGNSLG